MLKGCFMNIQNETQMQEKYDNLEDFDMPRQKGRERRRVGGGLKYKRRSYHLLCAGW
jgi:hypothetical protein